MASSPSYGIGSTLQSEVMFEHGSFFGTQEWPMRTRPSAKIQLVDSESLRRYIVSICGFFFLFAVGLADCKPDTVLILFEWKDIFTAELSVMLAESTVFFAIGTNIIDMDNSDPIGIFRLYLINCLFHLRLQIFPCCQEHECSYSIVICNTDDVSPQLIL